MERVQDLDRQINLITGRMIDNGINVKALWDKFLGQFERGTPQMQSYERILKESGKAAVDIWVTEEMLGFFKAREDVGSAIRQKGLDMGSRVRDGQAGMGVSRAELMKRFLDQNPERVKRNYPGLVG